MALNCITNEAEKGVETGRFSSSGEIVFLMSHDGESQKLKRKYRDLYRIIKVLPHNRFIAEDTL